MLRWHAHDSSKGVGRVREPISGESFAGIEERAHSLLRESIQNSLDARPPHSRRPVRIRIYLSGSTGALSQHDAARWFADAWPHIKADPKLRGFNERASCSFLSIEDFSTRGLVGDIRERDPDESSDNAWCLFFRKEGQSAKSETERGRWGIGKVVFPLCSTAHTFIAATVRADDNQRLVMGQSMLRSRTVAGKRFLPDLWYCVPDAAGFELPSDSTNEYEDLKATFRLQRDREPGLSVVIPYVDETITRDELVKGVVKEFFYPILDGSLIVEVESAGYRDLVMSQTTLLEEAASLRDSRDEHLYELADMARWHIEASEGPVLALEPTVHHGFEWADDQLSKEQIIQLKNQINVGGTAWVRLPIPILSKQNPSQMGHFDVVLRSTEEAQARRPVFVRSDLVIPEVKGRSVRGFLALVVAKEKTVSTMLGDAENPAHTDWTKNSSNFEPKYKYPNKHLDYVKHSASNLCQLLATIPDDRAEDALIDFFFLDVDLEGDRPTSGSRSGDKGRPQPPEPPPGRPRPYRVGKLQGGCIVNSTTTSLPPGRGLTIELAYAIRRGDPLKRYDPADFDLSKLGVVARGVRVVEQERNRVVVVPTDRDFSVQLLGFDSKRDLFVRVRETEVRP